jgi:hypothetical protein
MADLFKQNAINIDEARTGKWFDFDEDGAAFMLRRIPNDDYEECVERLTKERIRKFRRNEISRMSKINIVIEAIVETVLLDWRKIEWNGKKLPFSKENALMVLKDEKAGRSIVDMIFGFAGSPEEWKLEQFEEDAKN